MTFVLIWLGFFVVGLALFFGGGRLLLFVLFQLGFIEQEERLLSGFRRRNWRGSREGFFINCLIGIVGVLLFLSHALAGLSPDNGDVEPHY